MTNSTSVVWTGDASEFLLAGCVPYLQSTSFVGHLYCFEAEIDSDGRHVVFFELVIAESYKKWAFSDSLVANNHYLERVVFTLYHPLWYLYNTNFELLKDISYFASDKSMLEMI